MLAADDEHLRCGQPMKLSTLPPPTAMVAVAMVGVAMVWQSFIDGP